MADPVELQALGARYGATALGLLIGTAAKYGLTLTEGRRVSWRAFVGDLLLLGILGVIALVITDTLALTGNAKVLVGALAAVSSDRLVRLARERFMRRVDAAMRDDIAEKTGQLRNIIQTEMSAQNILKDHLERPGE